MAGSWYLLVKKPAWLCDKTTLISSVCCWCCSVAKSCSTLWDPINCSMPGFLILHCLPECAQTHVHWVSNAIQLSHPLFYPSSLALNLSQHQDLSQWVGCLHQVAKLSELQFQLQHQFGQWIFRVDFIYDWLVWCPCCPRETQPSLWSNSHIHIWLLEKP